MLLAAATVFLSVDGGGRFSLSAEVVVIDDVADSYCINKLSAVHLLLSFIIERLFGAAVAVAAAGDVVVI